MTRYIPSSVAEELSAELWALSRPDAGAQDTRYLFSAITALDGTRWLVALDDYDIYIHPDATLGGIADILQPWIDAGQLPADTNTQLEALIASKRGQRLVVYDAFPDLFKNMSKTYEQMIDAGLLAEPAML